MFVKQENESVKDYICYFLTDSKYDIEEQKEVLETLYRFTVDLNSVRIELVKWPSYSIHKYYVEDKLICKIYDGEITWIDYLAEEFVWRDLPYPDEQLEVVLKLMKSGYDMRDVVISKWFLAKDDTKYYYLYNNKKIAIIDNGKITYNLEKTA